MESKSFVLVVEMNFLIVARKETAEIKMVHAFQVAPKAFDKSSNQRITAMHGYLFISNFD